MERRVWTGVIAGVAAALVLGMVALIGFRAGQDDDAVSRVVRDGDGEIVRVVEDGWHGGPGIGFLFFPLLVFLVLALVFRGRRHWNGHGYAPGRWGPGHWGPGGQGGYGGYGPSHDPQARFDEWHRQAHGEPPAAGTGTATATPPTEPFGTEEGEAPAPPPPRDTA